MYGIICRYHLHIKLLKSFKYERVGSDVRSKSYKSSGVFQGRTGKRQSIKRTGVGVRWSPDQNRK